MKTPFIALLLCFAFLGASPLSAQIDVDFSFQFSKGALSLGTRSGSTTGASPYTTTAPITTQLCPGDQLTIKNFSYLNGNQLNYDGAVAAYRGQFGLSSSTGTGVPMQILGDICVSNSSGFYSGCTTTSNHIPSWGWGTTITLTIPNYNSTTGNVYLVLSKGIMGYTTTNHGCGQRYIFVPISLAPSTSISNQTICPGDAVSIPTTSGFTYSNWSPSNPNVDAPTTTTTYTVDITHTATGCTQTEQFTINVNNPENELLTIDKLCYNQGYAITENAFWDLYGSSTWPKQISVNGTVIADDGTMGATNLPHVIDAITYGAGTVTIEYEYYAGGSSTCTKVYEIEILPEIVVNVQNVYSFCNSNFQPICATTSGIAQSGVAYQWSYGTGTNVVATGVCFTPTAYGTYWLTAFDKNGCLVKRRFTVLDPGVGIKHPANITFCSLTQRSPGYIGWVSDPFGPILYSFAWTYTNTAGVTTPIVNTGAQYQVPYLGPGVYTAVVNANGCTETISITVTDLLQTYNNHSNAAFSFTPLGGNEVSCQPTLSMFGVTDVWTVTDQWGNTVAKSNYLNGIKFSYATGVEYTVKLTRYAYKACQVFTNEFKWEDNTRKATVRKRSSNNDLDLTEASTITVFPNPTTGTVKVSLPNTNNSTIEVFNALGQVVLQKTAQDQDVIELDLSNYNSGIYMIQVINGEEKYIEKVVKQ